MNVRPSLDSLPAPAAKVDPAASRASAQPSPQNAPAPPASGADADRVELSAAALAQASSASPVESGTDLEVARTALRSGADLSASEIHDLRQKVRSGHYDQPDVLDRVAGAAARDLAAE